MANRDALVRELAPAAQWRELAILKNGAAFTRSHPFLRLVPFVFGRAGIVTRVRFCNSELDPDAKHPILLLRDSSLTRLILDDVHT